MNKDKSKVIVPLVLFKCTRTPQETVAVFVDGHIYASKKSKAPNGRFVWHVAFDFYIAN